jgi:hypothetical protein
VGKSGVGLCSIGGTPGRLGDGVSGDSFVAYCIIGSISCNKCARIKRGFLGMCPVLTYVPRAHGPVTR